MRVGLNLPGHYGGGSQARLRTTNEVFVNEKAKMGRLKEMLCQHCFGCYGLKGQRSVLSELGP